MDSTELTDIADPVNAMRERQPILWKGYTAIETTEAIRPNVKKIRTRVCYVNAYDLFYHNIW